MNNGRNPEIVDLEYPRSWQYVVIGSDEGLLAEAVAGAVVDRRHTLNVANRSRTGKYVSLKLELVVVDETDRNALFAALQQHEAVRMVL